MKAAVVVQARIHSTRLDAKIFYEVGGWPLLHHVLWRCTKVRDGVDVICASPNTDDASRFLPICAAVGARFVQGSQDDVLARYVAAARSGGYEAVLRVTSDCPLIDWAVCRAVLRPVLEGEADYSCNNAPPTFPHGLDCEAFTTRALLMAADEATDPFDREHVTPYLRRHPQLRHVNLPATDDRWKHLRVTLDYPQDLELLRAIESVRPLRSIESMQDLISVFAAYPALAEINAMRRTNR